MEERIMRQHGRTAYTAMMALALVVMFVTQLLGLTQPGTANAAGPQITVAVDSPSTGHITYDVTGNGTSTNDVLVKPGDTDLTWSVSFNDPNVNNVRVIEADSGLAADYAPGGQPIRWAFAPRGTPYVIGFFPQINGVETGETVYIRAYSVGSILTATPNEVVAGGPQVQIQAAFVPQATASYVFHPFSPSNTFGIPSTQVGIPVQYTEPGKYVPTVDFLNAQGTIIATATSNAVIVKFAAPAINCDRNNPKVGQSNRCTLVGADYETNANIIWSWTDHNGAHTFNSAQAFRAGQQASPNTFDWTADVAESFDLGVMMEYTDGQSFYEVARASTNIDVQPLEVLNPSIAMTLQAQANENELITIKIVATNVVTGEYAVILTGLPGVAPYNPVADNTVAKIRVGNTVTMNVPFAFSPAGTYTVTASLDAVVGGNWVSGVSSAQKPIKIIAQTTNPGDSFKPVLKIIANNATQNVTTTIRIEATGALTHENSIRLLGLPTGEYNLTLAASKGEVQVENIPNGRAYLVPFKFSTVGQIALTAQMDAVVDGGWKANVATASAIFQVKQTMVYLPIARVAPTVVSVTVTPAQPVVPKTVTLKVNEINGYSYHGPVSNPDADQVIWKVERQDGANWVTVLEYNSTVGANAGEQPNALQVTFWPTKAGNYRYSVHVDRVVANAWTTTAESSGSYTVKEK